MALWLFRLLLLLAVLVSAMMISMWVFAAYIIFAASGAADAESQRWTLSATIFLVVSSGLIALGVYGIVRGWKLSKEQQSSVNKGKKDIKAGRKLTEREANKAVDEWLGK